MTSVSVVIPCFNAERWLADCIRSATSQELTDGTIEVIVVDDGSTDRSVAIAEKCAGVKVVKLAHGGASEARNVGFEVSRGNYIQFLDADDILSAGKFAAQVEALRREKADVAYGPWGYLHSSPQREARGDVVDRALGLRQDIELFTWFWCPPAAYLFTREIVSKAGPWSKTLPVIQDARFALDCALAGARFVQVRQFAAWYRVHGDSSLSRRDPLAFIHDVMRNALEVQEIWRAAGKLGPHHTKALLQVFSFVGRASFERDPHLFGEALTELRSLGARGSSAGPAHFILASRILGFERAERLARVYRRMRGRSAVGPSDDCGSLLL